ncbi:MAG: tRNA preQ1(34) S-adenosylmethionine ribosyltransferase-isomerase QueA [Alphaproteobacteria bacterium]
MKVSAFDFDLDRALIAAHPAEPRDSARLLEVGDVLRDRGVRDLPELLAPGDVLVVNDTKVIPARLRGRRGKAGVELTLHKQDAPGRWRAFAKGARKLIPGDRIDFAVDFWADVAAKGAEGEVTVAFNLEGGALSDALDRHGLTPLPPYIKRDRARAAIEDCRDRGDYQTMFAKFEGAVAAPTAGFHFTPDLVAALNAAGVTIQAITLHVGAGTFLPVKTADTSDHKMHCETGAITPEAADAINRARAQGGRIVAVGSTALRVLEAAADDGGRISPFAGETDLFITPGYRFRAIDLMLTNFHLPRSTLFMLVCAFSGTARMFAAYDHAKQARYRFYSFGDCCLLHPAKAAAP